MDRESGKIAKLAKIAIEQYSGEYAMACAECVSKRLTTAETSAPIFYNIAGRIALSKETTAKVAYAMGKEFVETFLPKIKILKNPRPASQRSVEGSGYSTDRKSASKTSERILAAYITSRASESKPPSEAALIKDLKKIGYIKSAADEANAVGYYRKVRK